MRFVRTGLWAAGLLVAFTTASAAASPRIVGGQTMTDSQQAPWSVLIIADKGNGKASSCSGSIIDGGRVVTAAHCLFNDGQPLPASAFVVRAGIADARQGTDQSKLQARKVTEAAPHPGYVKGAQTRNDAAVLTLATPFDVSGPYVRTIGIATSSPAPGSTLRLYGWGQTFNDGTTSSSDQRQRFLDFTTVRPYSCQDGAPSNVCAFSPTGAACRGDSGGGMVTSGPTPTLVAVSSFSVGDEACDAGDLSAYADLTAPEIAGWMAGKPYTAAPVGESGTRAGISSTEGAIAGSTPTCLPAAFSGSPSLKTSVVDARTQQTLGAGGSYVIPDSLIGSFLLCVTEATNAGGRAESASLVFKVLPPVDPGNVVKLNRRGRITVFSDAKGAVPARLTFRKGNRVVKTRSFTFETIPGAAPRLPRGRYQVCLTTARFSIYAESTVCTSWRRR